MHYRAFGLDFSCAEPLPGLTPAPAGLDATVVRAATVTQVNAVWPAAGTRRLVTEGPQDPALTRTVEVHPTLGYRLSAPGYGLAHISADGRAIDGAPLESVPGRWQRFLIARVLPWAALIRGTELLHAAAVEVDGRAAALVGPSGIGKTSLALRWVLDGGSLLTDDVLALRRDGSDAVVAHPASAQVGVRAAEHERLEADSLRRLGATVALDDKTYGLLPVTPRPCPLAAVYLLTRAAGPAGPPIEPMTPVDPSLLMASVFIVGLASPQRLRNLLELVGAIADSVPVFQVRITPALDAAALAQRLREHFTQLET